jgi:hypothetical protein
MLPDTVTVADLVRPTLMHQVPFIVAYLWCDSLHRVKRRDSVRYHLAHWMYRQLTKCLRGRQLLQSPKQMVSFLN